MYNSVCFRVSGLVAVLVTVPSCLKLLFFFFLPIAGWLDGAVPCGMQQPRHCGQNAAGGARGCGSREQGGCPELGKRVQQRLFSCLGLGCHHFNSSLLPQIIVVFFLPIAGRLYGAVRCGPKRPRRFGQHVAGGARGCGSRGGGGCLELGKSVHQCLFSCIRLGCHCFNSSLLPQIIVVSCPLQAGWTALCIAAENGHDTVVKALLDKGAAVDHSTEVGVLNLGRAYDNVCFRASGVFAILLPVHLASNHCCLFVGHCRTTGRRCALRPGTATTVWSKRCWRRTPLWITRTRWVS